jgi:hypothetical protein
LHFSYRWRRLKKKRCRFSRDDKPNNISSQSQNKCQETEIMKRDPQRSEGTCQKGMPEETCQMVPLSRNKALYYQVGKDRYGDLQAKSCGRCHLKPSDSKIHYWNRVLAWPRQLK